MSWSGPRSKATAELLKVWTKCVIQATQPWISTNIDRGAVWSSTINDELKEASFGIVCLTHENKEKPWILFESGALAKGLAENRVCTFLIDLSPQDVGSPLSQFNHTTPDRESMLSLAATLNRSSNAPLEPGILAQVFETNWAWFEKSFQDLLETYPLGIKPEARTEESILSEILDSVRGFDHRLRSLEARNSGGGKNSLASLWTEASGATLMGWEAEELEKARRIVDNLAKAGAPMVNVEKILAERFGDRKSKDMLNFINSRSENMVSIAHL